MFGKEWSQLVLPVGSSLCVHHEISTMHTISCKLPAIPILQMTDGAWDEVLSLSGIQTAIFFYEIPHKTLNTNQLILKED